MRMAVENGDWDEVHVGYDVVQAEGDEGKRRPPDGHDLG